MDLDDTDKENNASKQPKAAPKGSKTASKVNKRKAKAAKADNNDNDHAEESDSVEVAPSKQAPSKKQKLDPSHKANKEKASTSSSSAVKNTETVSHLVQFKNGKLVLKQKKVDWGQQNIALQRRIAWNAFLEEQEEALEAVPEEHLPLILLLAIESEKTPSELTKQIKASLCPVNAVDEDSQESTTSSIDKLPLPVLQKAIASVAERVNHGFRDNSFFDNDGDDDMDDENANKEERDLPEGYEVVPNGLRVWRWEIKDDYRESSEVYRETLSEEIRKKIESRLEERQTVREEAKKVLASMSEKEIKEILTKGSKAEGKNAISKEGKKASVSVPAEEGSRPSSKAKGKKKATQQEDGEEAEEGDKQEEGSDSAKPKSKGGKKKKELTAEEQAAKEAEEKAKEAKKAEAAEKKRIREEKKAVKDAEKAAKEAVKAKKEEVMKKQQNFFGRFIVKTGTSPAAEDAPLPSSSTGLGTPGPSSAIQVPSSSAAASPAHDNNHKDREGSVSATPAPSVNLLKSKKSGKSDYQIAFKPFNPRNAVELAPSHAWTNAKRKSTTEHDTDEISAADSLKQFIAIASPSRLPSKVPFSERENLGIDFLMSSLQEAEIASDKLEASRLRAILRNTSKVPFKLLKFATDVRPGYFGTWTKKSTAITGRNPFKQDTGILEYEYDSEAEWEEDDPTAEDVEEGPVNDEEEPEDSDSDLDGWLAGDDEDIEMEKDWTALDGSEEPEDSAEAQATKLKVTKTTIKKKLTGPLVPVIKGPCFTIDGTESGDAKWLAQFSMQWLGGNEAGSLDPFTFVEKPARLTQKAVEAASASKDGETTLKAKKALVSPTDLPLFNATVLASSSTSKPKLLDELVAAFDVHKIKVSKACLQRQVEESVNKKKKDEIKEGDCLWTVVDQKK